MRRLKTLAGCSLVIFLLFVITSSVYHPATPSGSDRAITSETQNEPKVDPEALRQYRMHQQELQKALTTYFDTAITAGDIVGAGVTIVKGDSIVLAEGYGRRSHNSTALVEGTTVFRLGSLSKGFAGILAAGLKHDGKLRWEDRVNQYFPHFQLGDIQNTDKITLATIMSHTSGVPYHSYTNLIEAGIPVKDIAERFQEVVPISLPGELYSYQNAMFALCGEVMQTVTGQEMPVLLENRFFKPLGMSTATVDYEILSHMENIALPHSKGSNGWRSIPLKNSYSNAIVAGGINASALDMGKWMRFVLGHNPELMDRATIEEAFQPRIRITGQHKYYQRWAGHVSSFYGFGWRIHKFTEDDNPKEKTIWHHGGSVNDYRNEIAMYPEADLGICVLLNSNSQLAKKVIPDVYEIVKKVYGADISKDFRQPSVTLAPSRQTPQD